MLEILAIIIAIAFFIAGYAWIPKTKGKTSSNTNTGDIIPKHKKQFIGRLGNTTVHRFREIRYGAPRTGELMAGGGSPASDNCAVHHVSDFDADLMKDSRCIICELID